jgi:hypothetical protein
VRSSWSSRAMTATSSCGREPDHLREAGAPRDNAALMRELLEADQPGAERIAGKRTCRAA